MEASRKPADVYEFAVDSEGIKEYKVFFLKFLRSIK
jgi:hypothetical protein